MAKKKVNEKKYVKSINITEGVNVFIEGTEIVAKKDGKEIRRKLNPLMGLKVESGEVITKINGDSKKEKKIFGSYNAHIKNMIKGLTEGFSYKLQVANVHFPMNVTYDKAANEIVVKNFLGEKKERRIKLAEGVEVKIDKDIIEIKSHDIEKAGQSAANIEKGTKVTKKDRRVYQDGIFIIEKPGRSFL